MIRDAGGEAVFVKTDVRIADEVKNMADKAVEAFGRLDMCLQQRRHQRRRRHHQPLRLRTPGTG